MNEHDFDPYLVLGVGSTATSDEINQAYRKKAAVMHPDHNPDDRRAKERFQKLMKAYDVLRDPEKRRAWDQTGTVSTDESMDCPICMQPFTLPASAITGTFNCPHCNAQLVMPGTDSTRPNPPGHTNPKPPSPPPSTPSFVINEALRPTETNSRRRGSKLSTLIAMMGVGGGCVVVLLLLLCAGVRGNSVPLSQAALVGDWRMVETTEPGVGKEDLSNLSLRADKTAIFAKSIGNQGSGYRHFICHGTWGLERDELVARWVIKSSTFPDLPVGSFHEVRYRILAISPVRLQTNAESLGIRVEWRREDVEPKQKSQRQRSEPANVDQLGKKRLQLRSPKSRSFTALMNTKIACDWNSVPACPAAKTR